MLLKVSAPGAGAAPGAAPKLSKKKPKGPEPFCRRDVVRCSRADRPPTIGKTVKVSTTRTWQADRGSRANAQLRWFCLTLAERAGLAGDRPGTVRCAASGETLAVSPALAAAYGLPLAEVDRVGACEGTDLYVAGEVVFAHPYVNGTLRNGGRVGPATLARMRTVAALGAEVETVVENDAHRAMRALAGEVEDGARARIEASVRD